MVLKKEKKKGMGGGGAGNTKPKDTDINFGKVAPKTLIPVFLTLPKIHSV